jgi:hypothetical protein
VPISDFPQCRRTKCRANEGEISHRVGETSHGGELLPAWRVTHHAGYAAVIGTGRHSSPPVGASFAFERTKLGDEQAGRQGSFPLRRHLGRVRARDLSDDTGVASVVR